jgi:hypothetical protein
MDPHRQFRANYPNPRIPIRSWFKQARVLLFQGPQSVVLLCFSRQVIPAECRGTVLLVWACNVCRQFFLTEGHHLILKKLVERIKGTKNDNMVGMRILK